MAYYWLCKAGKWQINESMSKSGLYDLLLAFFAGYKLSFYYFQKILQKKIAGPFDSKHLLFTYFEDLNKMYDFMYKNYDPDIVEQADSNANDQVKLP